MRVVNERSRAVIVGLSSLLLLVMLVVPLQQRFKTDEGQSIPSKFEGAERTLLTESFSLPQGYEWLGKVKLSSAGHRAYILGRKAQTVSLLMWEDGVGVSVVDSLDFVPEGELEISGDGTRLVVLGRKTIQPDAGGNQVNKSVYFWEEGFGTQNLLSDKLIGNWSVSFAQSGNSIALLPIDQNAYFTGKIGTLDYRKGNGILVDLESRYSDFNLRAREAQGDIPFQIRTISNPPDSQAVAFAGRVLTLLSAKKESESLELEKQIVERERFTSDDLDGDGASDLLLFSRGQEFPIWRGYTFGGIEGAKLGITGRQAYMATWRVGDGAGIPVSGDYNGDGSIDFATFTPGIATDWNDINYNWKIFISVGPNAVLNRKLVTPTNIIRRSWGHSGMVAVPADYDGDGATDLGVFDPRNATWQLLYSAGGYDAAKASLSKRGFGLVKRWGKQGDIPIVGDFDGDSRADLAVWQLSTDLSRDRANWQIYLLGNGGEEAERSRSIRFGKRGDIPMAGDYNGDGRTDVAVYRPSERKWLIRVNSKVKKEIDWGIDGAEPIVGDFDGDGLADTGFFNPAGPNKWEIRNSVIPDKARSVFVGERHSQSRSSLGDIDGLPPQVWLRRHQAGVNVQ